MSETNPKPVTPRRAIRRYCLACCCGSPNEVRLCPVVKCPLHVHRFGKRPSPDVECLTPIKAMRARCLDCVGYERAEVRTCEITTCALWSFRMGRRPKSEGADA